MFRQFTDFMCVEIIIIVNKRIFLNLQAIASQLLHIAKIVLYSTAKPGKSD
jgi:hypothetical protein